MVIKPGHQRNQSAGQQLILDRGELDEIIVEHNYGTTQNSTNTNTTTASPSHPIQSDILFNDRANISKHHNNQYHNEHEAIPETGYCPSEASSHVAVHRAEQYADNLERENRNCCNNPKLRHNARVILASFILTLLGAALLIIGVVIMVLPNHTDLHGWVFLFVGFLFFTPGIYHVVYILCTLSGRPGYTFDNLPTFSK